MKAGSVTEGLLVHAEDPPISEETRTKDLDACIDPKDELKDEEFLKNASEVTYGIERSGRKWTYAWLLGYDAGAARGYHAGCAVSVLPPKSIVGFDQTFSGWKAVKEVYPDAEDAFFSPGHDLILIFYGNRLIAAPMRDGKVGKSLARVEIAGKPVMVQWAIGKYVDIWTKELTPYFGAYTPKSKPVK